MEKDTGNAQGVVIPSDHPELKRRSKEILEILLNLSDTEKWEAMKAFSITKWHRLNTATIDFKPESKGEENK